MFAITAGLKINTENFLIAADLGCSVLPTAAGVVLNLRCERDCLRQEEADSNKMLLL